jgi:hypothetical protein
MAVKADELIADYLREIKVSAWNRGVPREQVAALQSDVRSQIDAELAAAGSRDEATVYAVLDRLGPPSAFVSLRRAVWCPGSRRAGTRRHRPERRWLAQ